jgi:acetyl-CoA carboxylase alpha subunit
MKSDSDKPATVTKPEAQGTLAATACSADSSEKTWTFVSLVALAVTIVCIITGNGNSAIAASIIFATSIYGYEHRT